MQDRISKICNSLLIVNNLIKFGGIAHDNQEHHIYLNIFSVSFKSRYFYRWADKVQWDTQWLDCKWLQTLIRRSNTLEEGAAGRRATCKQLQWCDVRQGWRSASIPVSKTLVFIAISRALKSFLVENLKPKNIVLGSSVPICVSATFQFTLAFSGEES